MGISGRVIKQSLVHRRTARETIAAPAIGADADIDTTYSSNNSPGVKLQERNRCRRRRRGAAGAGHHAGHWCAQRIDESHAAAERAIEDFAALCRADGVPVRVLTREGDPIDLLIDAWRYHDLCGLGVRGWFDHEVVAEPTRALLKLVAPGYGPARGERAQWPGQQGADRLQRLAGIGQGHGAVRPAAAVARGRLGRRLRSGAKSCSPRRAISPGPARPRQARRPARPPGRCTPD